VARKGSLLQERLAEINSPHVQEVRGKGLLIGVALDIPAAAVVTAGYSHGLLLVGAGPDVLRLVPPLVISEDEIDQVVHRLSRILESV
jgi:acetylornithine/succinyldiaminopimelate/putrescine aminotransferase